MGSIAPYIVVMDVQPHGAPSESGSTAGTASRKRGNASSESEDTELYSASSDESSDDGFQPVLYRKAKRRIVNASSASSTTTVKTAPQRWPHSILFVPLKATDSLRGLNRQALSVYLENITPNQIKEIRLNARKNILAIDVLNPRALNALQKVTQLGNINVKSIIPADSTTSTGVIYDIATEIPNSDLSVLIKPANEDNVIVNVSRLGNTHCVRITFKGDCLPSHVKVGHFRHQVRPFIPKPMRCHKCQKIGHVQGACRNSEVCPRCSEPHTEDKCSATILKCPNCQGAHSASSKDCPRIKKEFTILRQMVRDSSTHKEAAEKVRRRRRRHRRRSSRRTESTTRSKSTHLGTAPTAGYTAANADDGREKTSRSLSTEEWPPLTRTQLVEEPHQKPHSSEQAATTEEQRNLDKQVIALLRPIINAIRTVLNNMRTTSARSALQVLDALSPVLAALE